MPTKTSARPETKGRTTLYKGIEMRSRLEADYAGHLDRAGARPALNREQARELGLALLAFADGGEQR